ncbi:hypothetical protein Tco_0978557 [Tanacetum coccineum]|uniref:Uncharacterized protein n=1 Tax=Tanacetum coccineum TaxID=301880 RepID=A0ABQ5ENE7_9ASTR
MQQLIESLFWDIVVCRKPMILAQLYVDVLKRSFSNELNVPKKIERSGYKKNLCLLLGVNVTVGTLRLQLVIGEWVGGKSRKSFTWLRLCKEVEEYVTKVIAKDGIVTRFGGQFPHFIEEEEEKKPKPYNLYGFVDLMENEQVYAKIGFAPHIDKIV